jgi:hypothetical protein
MIVTVSTACPFCGGSASLLREESDASDTVLVDRFRGASVTCVHAGCERQYSVRRGDIRIRRAAD